MSDKKLPEELLRLLKPRLPQMLATLRRLVATESPSLEKAAADRCCGVVATEWNKHGVRVERIRQRHRGDPLRITHAPGNSSAPGPPCVPGHYGTGFSTG